MSNKHVWRPEDHTPDENALYINYLYAEGHSDMAKIIYDYCKERGLV